MKNEPMDRLIAAFSAGNFDVKAEEIFGTRQGDRREPMDSNEADSIVRRMTEDQFPVCAICGHTKLNHDHLSMDNTGMEPHPSYCGYLRCECGQYRDKE